LFQIPRRPQASVPCANDTHINVTIAGQSGAVWRQAAHISVPKRNITIARHVIFLLTSCSHLRYADQLMCFPEWL
jgi:hypothetical protein